MKHIEAPLSLINPEKRPPNGRLHPDVISAMNLRIALLSRSPEHKEQSMDRCSIEFVEALNTQNKDFSELCQDLKGIFDAHSTEYDKFLGAPCQPHSPYGPAVVSMAELCVRTAPTFNIQEKYMANNDDRQCREHLSRYNGFLREAIVTHADLTREEFLSMLIEAMEWSKLPKKQMQYAINEILIRLYGACTEARAWQLFGSEAMKKEGILAEKTSTDDDLKGGDFNLFMPSGHKLLIDVKTSPQQVLKHGPFDDSVPCFNMHNMKSGKRRDKIALYDGARDAVRQGRLLLDESDVEPKAAALAAMLLEIDEGISAEHNNLLAQLALKFQK